MNPIILTNHRNEKIIVAPLIAELYFKNHLPKFNENFRLNTLPPENFSWHITTPDDSPSVVEKKKNITPVQNQYNCGCCWAMGIATSISDCFVVSGLTKQSPNISTTRIMMCVLGSQYKWKFSKCDGGNSAIAMNQLVNVDIVGNECIDYSWCTSNKYCISTDPKTPLSSLSCFVPGPCGCKTAGLYASYNIVNPSVHYLNEGEMDPTTISNFRATIRDALIQTGPLISGLAVYSNFITGNFTNKSINQGVYFDRCNYTKFPTPFESLIFSDESSSDQNFQGLHVINIIGWGLAKNVQYDTNKFGNVPFWWCRNSWGEKWGNDGGYFKIAMYPFNKKACFEPLFSHGGGIILYKPKGPPILKTFPKYEQDYTCDYYLTTTPPSNSWEIVAIVFIIVTVILIGYGGWKWFKNSRKFRGGEYMRMKLHSN